MITYRIGDIFQDKELYNYIAHGCNCHHIMGGGFAYIVAKNFPNTYLADIQNSIKGDVSKLGSYTYDIKDKILNLYTQYNLGANVDYDAIEKSLKLINNNFKGMNIAMPRIGCGIAGGDWTKVERLIYDNCKDINVTVYLSSNDFKNYEKLYFIKENIIKDGTIIYFKNQLVYDKILDDKYLFYQIV